MLRICLVFWKSKPQYAYKRYAYEKNMYRDGTESVPLQLSISLQTKVATTTLLI